MLFQNDAVTTECNFWKTRFWAKYNIQCTVWRGVFRYYGIWVFTSVNHLFLVSKLKSSVLALVDCSDSYLELLEVVYPPFHWQFSLYKSLKHPTLEFASMVQKYLLSTSCHYIGKVSEIFQAGWHAVCQCTCWWSYETSSLISECDMTKSTYSFFSSLSMEFLTVLICCPRSTSDFPVLPDQHAELLSTCTTKVRTTVLEVWARCKITLPLYFFSPEADFFKDSLGTFKQKLMASPVNED